MDPPITHTDRQSSLKLVFVGVQEVQYTVTTWVLLGGWVGWFMDFVLTPLPLSSPLPSLPQLPPPCGPL